MGPMESEGPVTLEALAALGPTELFLVCDVLTLGPYLWFFSSGTGERNRVERKKLQWTCKGNWRADGLFLDSQSTDVLKLKVLRLHSWCLIPQTYQIHSQQLSVRMKHLSQCSAFFLNNVFSVIALVYHQLSVIGPSINEKMHLEFDRWARTDFSFAIWTCYFSKFSPYPLHPPWAFNLFNTI